MGRRKAMPTPDEWSKCALYDDHAEQDAGQDQSQCEVKHQYAQHALSPSPIRGDLYRLAP